MALGNIDSLLRRIIRRKNSQASGKSNSSSSSTLSFKGKSIIILGIAVALIGFVGTMYFGSQFVKEEVNAGTTSPYTNPSHIKSALPMDLEIVFVVICVIGFGILTYGLVSRVDKPLDFYPA